MHRSRSRRPASERRIPPSGEGRIRLRPGDEHPLDVQFAEARAALVVGWRETLLCKDWAKWHEFNLKKATIWPIYQELELGNVLFALL